MVPAPDLRTTITALKNFIKVLGCITWKNTQCQNSRSTSDGGERKTYCLYKILGVLVFHRGSVLLVRCSVLKPLVYQSESHSALMDGVNKPLTPTHTPAHTPAAAACYFMVHKGAVSRHCNTHIQLAKHCSVRCLKLGFSWIHACSVVLDADLLVVTDQNMLLFTRWECWISMCSSGFVGWCWSEGAVGGRKDPCATVVLQYLVKGRWVPVVFNPGPHGGCESRQALALAFLPPGQGRRAAGQPGLGAPGG